MYHVKSTVNKDGCEQRQKGEVPEKLGWAYAVEGTEYQIKL